MNFTGIVIGLVTFLVIGLFHPLVIKAEYYIGVKSWWLFLLLGLVASAASVLVDNLMLSIILGVVAFSSFWSIGEVFQQKKRVEKGWFPANPEKKKEK
jgi:branched-subunit amino acid transport protein